MSKARQNLTKRCKRATKIDAPVEEIERLQERLHPHTSYVGSALNSQKLEETFVSSPIVKKKHQRNVRQWWGRAIKNANKLKLVKLRKRLQTS